MPCRLVKRWIVVGAGACVLLVAAMGVGFAASSAEQESAAFAESAESAEIVAPPTVDADAEASVESTEAEPVVEGAEPVEQESAAEDPAEQVSPLTEATLWMQDDLRQSLDRAAALCGRRMPVWPGRHFERIEVEAFAEEGGSILRGMQGAQDPAVRIRALEALGQSGGASDLDACLASLLDPEERVRRAAADAVASLCQRPANAPLAEQLLLRVFDVFSTWGFQERAVVDVALPQWSTVLCAPARRAMESDETAVEQRAIAAYCLGRMGCHEASHTLASLAQDEDKTLAREAAGALYRLRDPESTRAWVELTRHTDPFIQRLSLEALASLGDSLALETLTSISLGADGYSGTMQIMATNALSVWPKEASLPRLIQSMMRNPTVREYAVARLREITGLPIPDIPSQWQEWYETGELPEGVTLPATGPMVEIESL